MGQTLCFSELRKRMLSVTQRMLTKQLRELERDGIVARHVYAEVPPKVEYCLTTFGEALTPLLNALEAWGSQSLETIIERRTINHSAIVDKANDYSTAQ